MYTGVHCPFVLETSDLSFTVIATVITFSVIIGLIPITVTWFTLFYSICINICVTFAPFWQIVITFQTVSRTATITILVFVPLILKQSLIFLLLTNRTIFVGTFFNFKNITACMLSCNFFTTDTRHSFRVTMVCKCSRHWDVYSPIIFC